MPTYMRKDDHGYRFLRPIPQDLRTLFKKANFVNFHANLTRNFHLKLTHPLA